MVCGDCLHRRKPFAVQHPVQLSLLLKTYPHAQCASLQSEKQGYFFQSHMSLSLSLPQPNRFRLSPVLFQGFCPLKGLKESFFPYQCKRVLAHVGTTVNFWVCANYRVRPLYVYGFDSQLGRDLSMWNLHVLPMFLGVSSGCSGFPPPSKHVLGLSPIRTIGRGTG